MNLYSINRRHAALAFLVYLVFVVYGSLLPFEYRDHTLEQAIVSFSNIGYLNLGVGSRADWIANIVLYVPLAFLGCTWILGMGLTSAWKHIALVPVFAICLAVAVSVEFTQIFFAPRTVSINDLVAETLGILIGILLWALGRWRIVQLWEAFLQGGRRSVLAVITTYGLAYIALSLFPYDFVISAQELSWRLESRNLGWLITANCSSWVRCGAHLAGDAIGLAPLGLLLLLANPRASLLRIFVAGIGLGLVLESMQLFLASGSSQGLSAVMRGLGLAGGAAVGRLLMSTGSVPLARIVWRAAPVLAIPYFMFLALVNGWFSSPLLSPGEALGRLSGVEFLPFYYHYFTSEPVAMASLLANVTMYGPVGLAFWARETSRVRMTKKGALGAALWAVCLAFPIEMGKLLFPPKHPDFTNLLIAAGAAAFTLAVARWIENILTGASPRVPPRPEAPAISRPEAPVIPRPAAPAIEWPKPPPLVILLGLPALSAVLLGLVNYPVGGTVLAVVLLLYGWLLWRAPLIWFFLIPALLPLLDLSQLTGRLLLDELDLFVLVTLAVSYPRIARVTPRPWPNALLPATLILLWVSWGLAMARGLWFLVDMEGEITASSHSPLEAWLVGKGMLWALLLVPVIRRLPPGTGSIARNHLLGGLATGLAMLSLAVVWERHVYVGLGNLDNVFRVTGTFASMHTGGAYIEAFIAFAFPALAVWVLIQKNWALKVLGIGLAVLSSYAMLVTFSRGGYAGLAAGLLVVILGTLRMRSGLPSRRGLALAGLSLAVLAVALPILSGGFAQQRLARAAEDFSFRLTHWERALDLMDDGIAAAMAGMGFGQYPTIHLLYSDSPEPPGTYGILREGNNPYLNLGAGESVFLDQLVDVKPGMQYRLTARIRRQEGKDPLSLPLCEKALLYSFECIWNQLEPESPEAGWSTLSIQGDAGQLGGGGHWPHRTVKLSLYNPGNSTIHVDDVSLETRNGQELIVNGDFSNGVEHWLFVTDQDLAWHIHQQWVEMYFAQGFLGIFALLVLLVAVAKVLAPQVMSGNLYATALAAAMLGFLTVGLLGSTMDTARLSMLFYLGALSAVLLIRHEKPNDGHSTIRKGD